MRGPRELGTGWLQLHRGQRKEVGFGAVHWQFGSTSAVRERARQYLIGNRTAERRVFCVARPAPQLLALGADI
jgi:hypothetical protein